MEINNKIALVTGGTKGIGLSTAESLSSKGAKVVITARNAPDSNKVEELKNNNIVFKPMDVTSEEDVSKIVKEVHEEFGAIDILVNSAGITIDKPLSVTKLEDFKKVIDVNLIGTFLVTKWVIKIMRKQGLGSIVNLSSISANGNIGQANYSSSKAGIIGLTRTTAKEGVKKHIRCNAIAPGFIMTDMISKLGDQKIEDYKEIIPMNRLGNPSEIAETVEFLVKNDYITGQVITVDGGLTL